MKKMVKSLVLVSLLLAFAAVSVAAANKAEGKKKESPTVKSKEGKEAKELANLFKKHPEVDKDKDGKVSKEEKAAFYKLMAANGVMKAPYLMYEGVNTEMTVLCQMSSAETCKIVWGLNTTYAQGSASMTAFNTTLSEKRIPKKGLPSESIAAFTAAEQYKYTITGLKPGTKYYYKITGAKTGLVGKGSFRTAPSDSATNVKFMFYGDTRRNTGPNIFQNNVAGKVINTYTADPEFQTLMLHGGDWATGSSEDHWRDEHFPLNQPNLVQFKKEMPIAGCRGNHDSLTFGKYYPYPYEGDFYWSFDYGPAHIVIVNQYSKDKIYETDSDQYKWLVNDLAKSTKKWKFIVLHDPGWSAGGNAHGNNKKVQSLIQPLCLQYGVDIVFAAHNHYYARCSVDGIEHITSGGGGAGQAVPGPIADNENLVVAEKNFHHVEITIAGDQLNGVAKRDGRPGVVAESDGTTLDSFTISKTPPAPAAKP